MIAECFMQDTRLPGGRVGSDCATRKAASAEACQRLCQLHVGCVGFTYIDTGERADYSRSCCFKSILPTDTNTAYKVDSVTGPKYCSQGKLLSLVRICYLVEYLIGYNMNIIAIPVYILLLLWEILGVFITLSLNFSEV